MQLGVSIASFKIGSFDTFQILFRSHAAFFKMSSISQFLPLNLSGILMLPEGCELVVLCWDLSGMAGIVLSPWIFHSRTQAKGAATVRGMALSCWTAEDKAWGKIKLFKALLGCAKCYVQSHFKASHIATSSVSGMGKDVPSIGSHGRGQEEMIYWPYVSYK